MKKTALSALFALAVFLPSARAADISYSQVVLRGLDKITGRLSTMTVNVGDKTVFGELDVYVRVCYARPPEETPENAAYLDVVENKIEGQLKLFSGWMFSSSPALSAMEHPVYDIWVLRCQGEEITPPKPAPLVLEKPIEALPAVTKVKIKVLPEQTTEQKAEPDESKKAPERRPEPPAEEPVEAPAEETTDDSADSFIVPVPMEDEKPIETEEETET